MGGEFGDERPSTFLGGFVEEVLEWALQAELVDNLAFFEVLEVFDVCPDDRVGGSEFEHRMFESYRKLSARFIIVRWVEKNHFITA